MAGAVGADAMAGSAGAGAGAGGMAGPVLLLVTVLLRLLFPQVTGLPV